MATHKEFNFLKRQVVQVDPGMTGFQNLPPPHGRFLFPSLNFPKPLGGSYVFIQWATAHWIEWVVVSTFGTKRWKYNLTSKPLSKFCLLEKFKQCPIGPLDSWANLIDCLDRCKPPPIHPIDEPQVSSCTDCTQRVTKEGIPDAILMPDAFLLFQPHLSNWVHNKSGLKKRFQNQLKETTLHIIQARYWHFWWTRTFTKGSSWQTVANFWNPDNPC